MNLKELDKPFQASEVEWRIAQSGLTGNGKVWAKVLAYVTNRAIMDRLDAVCGKENWKNEFKPGPQKGIVCGISIKIGDEWVEKWDGADETDVEAVKGGLSGSMKRAAVQWGLGRYLYNLEEGWAETTTEQPNGSDKGEWTRAVAKKDKQDRGTPFWWKPPRLPAWALPEGTTKPVEPQKPQGNGNQQRPPQQQKPEPPATKPEEPTLTQKDNWIIAEVAKCVGEAKSETDIREIIAMLKKPDAAVNKADNVALVKKRIWDTIKSSRYMPKDDQQPDYVPEHAQA